MNMSKKIRFFLLSCALMIMCCMGITAGASDNAKVIAHNLTITDEGISVNFYVDIDAEAKNDTKVTLNGKQVDIPRQTEIIVDAKAYSCYKFTQPVVAKRMDDKVSLKLVTEGQELVDEYSINDYVDEVNNEYGYNFQKLAEAMSFYGEFAEAYFDYNDQGITPEAASSISSVEASDFEDYRMQQGEIPEGLTFAGVQLNLTSKITLRLCFEEEEDSAGSYDKFVAEYGDSSVKLDLKKVGDYYCLDIEGIGADALDRGYTIKCGDTTVFSNCSVLSYAGTVVRNYNGTGNKTELVDLSKALYLYNQKADTYVEGQATAVYDIFYGENGFSATPDNLTPVYLTVNVDGTKEVTTQNTGTQVTTLSQLNSTRTKGCSVWMEKAYTVSAEENVTTGPYVIRRYDGNTGNVLNVAGTATLNAKVDGSCGDFVARYAADKTVEFEIAKSDNAVSATNSIVNVAAGATFTINGASIENSHVKNGEVYVSGTPAAFNVTGAAKSGVINVSTDVTNAPVSAEGLTAKGNVVFANHKGVALSGNGEVSAIKLFDDSDKHFGIVKPSDSVRIASIICVCGANVSEDHDHTCPWIEKENKTIEDVYALDWQAWDAKKTALPTTAGSYYLTGNMELATSERVTAADSVHLDLNGKTATRTTSANHENYRTLKLYFSNVKAQYTISDSQGGGTICFAEDFATYLDGELAHVVYGWLDLYGGTLDLSNIGQGNGSKGANFAPLHLTYASGKQSETGMNVYGGTIKAAKNKIKDTKTNCIIVKSSLSVYGGTIEGEVAIPMESENLGKLTVGGSAKVGVPLTTPDSTQLYGIVMKAGATIAYDGVKEDAVINLKSGVDNITLEEVTNSANSVASAFKLLDNDESKDGHYGVVKRTDGTLDFGSTVCVCGATVNGDSEHPCHWLTKEKKTMDDIFALDWQPWDDDNTALPHEAGSYYLVGETFLSTVNDVTAWSSVHLDLNGHTATKKATSSSKQTLRLYFADVDAQYAISDSKGGGTINFEKDYESTLKGGLTHITSGWLDIYGGLLDMSNYGATNNQYYPINLTYGGGVAGGTGDNNGKATVEQTGMNVYGGTIKGAKATSTVLLSNCIYFQTSLSIYGGTIEGQVVMADGEADYPSLTIDGSPKVGVSLDDETQPHGIETWSTTSANLNCAGVTDKARIVFLSGAKFTLSGTEALEAFEVAENRDGHYGVVRKADGTLGFGSTICACGANVSEEPTHTCPWLDKVERDIDYVYKLDWQPWDGNNKSLPTEAGYYYLTEDIDLTDTARVTGTSSVHLDLNGKTATKMTSTDGATSTTNRTLQLYFNDVKAQYTIADSKGKGTIRFAENFESGASGELAHVTSGWLDIYGGTFDMTNIGQGNAYRKGANGDGPLNLTYGGNGATSLKAGMNLYGGTIKGTKDRAEAKTNCIMLNSTLSVYGGTIEGEVYMRLKDDDVKTLTVAGSAKVGVPMEDLTRPYGLKAKKSGATVECQDVNEQAEIVFYSGTYFSLSGTGTPNAFTFVDGKHEAVIDEETDSLKIQMLGGVQTFDTFVAGFGKTKITPTANVYLGSHGDTASRLSTGVLDDLYALTVAMTDTKGNTMLWITTDLSHGSIEMTNLVREAVLQKYYIPKENVLLGGTHNHSSVDWSYEANKWYQQEWLDGVMESIDAAMANRSAATMEIGRTETEDLNFVRRYVATDGTYLGSNPGDNTAGVKHEEDADEELQMVRFIREGERPILITQWQCHACYVSGNPENENHYKLTAEWPGIMRDKVEEELDVHCIYLQGASGNVVDTSRLPNETKTTSYEDKGNQLANYVIDAYKNNATFTAKDTGIIKTNQAYLSTEKSGKWPVPDPEMNAVSIGDVSLVTLPQEMFSSDGQKIKANSPFDMTLIMGYACDSDGYAAPSWTNKYGINEETGEYLGGYEVNNSPYKLGAADKFVGHYQEKLAALFEQQAYIARPTTEVKNVLMLGNSFSYYFVEELAGIAEAGGLTDFKVANLYESGCSVMEHWANVQDPKDFYEEFWLTTALDRQRVNDVKTFDGALKYDSGKWDVITLQQHFYSEMAMNYNTALSQTESYTKKLFEHIKSQNSTAKLYWHQTWAYQVGYPLNGGDDMPIPDVATQTLTYENIRKVSQLVAQENGVNLIPSGDAWQIARADSRVGDNLCASDYYHDGDLGGGQYLNACVWYEVLTGKSCIGNTWRPTDYELSEDKIVALQKAAHAAVVGVYGPTYAR